ncbi:trans-sulfuration enzyme family protein [Mycolicibacterium smegmatis]|uniref:trans-sulfuration enzyme family protein n=1 Tax=Mycolicibacterium smegmatis TaxID=1772 RepID=UPI001303DB45|nr:PLP-dependent transferase [Mycolicibacterium smegmatis]
MAEDRLHTSTVAIHAGRGPRSHGAPLNPPLSLSSNFYGSDYAREQGSPTWVAFEEAIGTLEGGMSVAFASGIAATTAIIETLPARARVVGPAAGYAWTRSLLSERASAGRITLDEVDTCDTEATLRAATGADLLWLENPSNPLVAIAELDRICAALRDEPVRIAVDSTFATPLLQRPLEFGADFAMHSASKFIGGHSDLLLGVVSTRDRASAQKLRHVRAQLGATPGALESWLALRGLRTMPLRVEAAQRSALVLAQRLSAHPAVSAVHYAGLPEDPGHEAASRFMDGYGAMLSFELHGGAEHAEDVCANVRVFINAKSLGGVESLIDRRARHSGSSAPSSLIRISVGCENVEDLWNDLRTALEKETK